MEKTLQNPREVSFLSAKLYYAVRWLFSMFNPVIMSPVVSEGIIRGERVRVILAEHT